MKNPTKSPALICCASCNRPHEPETPGPEKADSQWAAPDLCAACSDLNKVQPHPGLTPCQTAAHWLDWIALSLGKTQTRPYRPNRIILRDGQLSFAHSRSLPSSASPLANLSTSDYTKGLRTDKWYRLDAKIRHLVKSGALK